MNRDNKTNIAKKNMDLNKFPFKLFSSKLFPSAIIALFLSVSSFIGIFLSFKINSLIILSISIVGLLAGSHLISVLRVARKYKKIITQIPKQIEKIQMSFWHLECIMKIKRRSPTYVLYQAGWCPYHIWIAYSYGLRGAPEQYQVWKIAYWWKKKIYMNPYDYSRYLYRGISRIVAKIVGYPVKKDFPVADDRLKEIAPEICYLFESVDHLVRVGFARRGGKNILLAILDKSADPENMVATIEILDKLEAKIKKLENN